MPRLYTRAEIVKNIIDSAIEPGPDNDKMTKKFNLCSEEAFMQLTGLPLKRIRKNLYYL